MHSPSLTHLIFLLPECAPLQPPRQRNEKLAALWSSSTSHDQPTALAPPHPRTQQHLEKGQVRQEDKLAPAHKADTPGLLVSNGSCCVSLLRAAAVVMATCDACSRLKGNVQAEISPQQQPCSREEKRLHYQETCLTSPGFSRHDIVKYSGGMMVGRAAWRQA